MKDHLSIADCVREERRKEGRLVVQPGLASMSLRPSAVPASSGSGGPVDFERAAAEQLLIDVRRRVSAVHVVHISDNSEGIRAINVVREVVHRLSAKGGLDSLEGGDVETLRSSRTVLKNVAGDLEVGDEVDDVDEKAELSEKRSSGEWVVVGDDDDFGSEKREVMKKDTADRKVLKQELETICASITQLIPLLSHLEASRSAQPFSQPFQITDFLGNTFPFPSEYSLAELEAIIKVRFARGPGSKHIQNGQFELLNAANRNEVLNPGTATKPGMKILIALVIDEVVGDGYMCPAPHCDHATTANIKEGGRVCNKCGLWFYQAKLPNPIKRSAPHTPNQKASETSPKELPHIPYKPNSKAGKTEEDISPFKYIKIYPLVDFADVTVGKFRFYQCQSCDTHLALNDDVISRNFRGQHGKALLINNVYNITRGPTQSRNMTTGKHEICDVFCKKCGECVGWAYEKAEYESEAYKLGKFLLEVERITPSGWEFDMKKLDSESPAGVKRTDRAGTSQREVELLSKVTTVKGELIGLEYLEERLRALMDEENGINRDKQDEEGF